MKLCYSNKSNAGREMMKKKIQRYEGKSSNTNNFRPTCDGREGQQK